MDLERPRNTFWQRVRQLINILCKETGMEESKPQSQTYIAVDYYNLQDYEFISRAAFSLEDMKVSFFFAYYTNQLNNTL